MSEIIEQERPIAVPGLAPTVLQPKVLTGRKKIKTSYLCPTQIGDGMYGTGVLNADTMTTVLNNAIDSHRDNAMAINYLMEYAKGRQDILDRQKDVRSDVNNRVVINYANAFTRDIVGYTFGKPSEYILRKGDETIKSELSYLNDCCEYLDKNASDTTKATTASICGISHRGIFPNPSDENVPFSYVDLDSEATFVVYSTQMTSEPVFACTYSYGIDDSGNETVVYYVYTKDEIYVYEIINSDLSHVSDANIVEGFPKANPLGMVNIIENENNQFRMGHWETALTLFNAINIVGSDSVNDVEQFVNSILVAINAEMDEDTLTSVRNNKYAEIKSSQGMQADLKYISEQLDGGSVEQLRQYLEDCLRIVVGIPDRKTRGGGGGDTGDAVKLRDGWADMEIVARTTETFARKSEKNELKIILSLLKDLQKIETLSIIDIDIKYPRNQSDNILTKANAYNMLHSTGTISPEDNMEIVNLTNNAKEIVERGATWYKENNVEGQSSQPSDDGGTDVTQEGGNE